MTDSAQQPSPVDRGTWLAARRALLEQEKNLTRQYDEVRRARLRLPRVLVDCEYLFDSLAGPVSLAGLFGSHSQLLIYHFMYGPHWDTACKSCSFWADQFDAIRPHLLGRDIALVVASSAPLEKLAAFAQRMDWRFPWVSASSEFNREFGVTFTASQVAEARPLYNYGSQAPFGEESPGLSSFLRDEEGRVLHTYSTYARGLEAFNAAYRLIDLAPLGRRETRPMDWLEYRDEYAG